MTATMTDPAAKKAAKAAANARYRAAKKAAKAATAPAPAEAPAATPPPAKVEADRPTGKLEERAMLVTLSIGYWEGLKADRNKTGEVTKDEKAAADAGTWITRVVPPAAIKPVLLARDKAREVHFKYTLPWQDGGVRVLPANMFMEYTKAMRAAEEGYRAAVNAFLAEYPTILANAEERLGGLFKADFFPRPEQLKYKYPWTMRINPIPTAGDFRVALTDDAIAEIKAGIAKQNEVAMADAMGDLWNRLYEQVGKIAERLGDEKGVFRDSLIENVAALCELLPRMNVTGNKELEAMRKAVVAKLAKTEPEVLRKNKTARAEAAKDANDILKKMEAFLGTKKTA